MPLVDLGPNASLNGCRPFIDSLWNTPIDEAPLDRRSDELVAILGTNFDSEAPQRIGLKAEFGSARWQGALNGLPYHVVGEGQRRMPVVPILYPEESESGLMPIPHNVIVEGQGGHNTGLDRHVIVVQRDASTRTGLGRLYELFDAERDVATYNGRRQLVWHCSNAAVWNLNGRGHGERPRGWTSADAAGLPIFPGLVRYDEVAAGEIRHALRFTTGWTRRAYVSPASHHASWFTATNPPPARGPLAHVPAAERAARLPPMGMRVRLRAGFDVTRFPRQVRVILRCLKRYGMILADNGGPLFISGAPDRRWNDDALAYLREVPASALEVVRMGPVHVD